MTCIPEQRPDVPDAIILGVDPDALEGKAPVRKFRRSDKIREVAQALQPAPARTPLKARFRMQRALEVIPPILEDYRLQRGNFTPDVVIPPQVRHIPPGMTPGSAEHVNWLFFVQHHMRGAITSDGAFRGHVRLYQLHPELYDAATVQHADPLEVAKKIDSAEGLGFASKQIARIWVHNARIVMERFGGDPFALYRDARSFSTIVRRAIGKNLPRERHIRGMRQKILSLLTIFYQGLELVPHFRDQTMPMDFQIVRLLIMLGVLEVDRPVFRVEESLLRRARAFSGKLTRALDVTADELSHALWLQGSEVCHRSPDNAFATPAFDEILAVSTPERSMTTTMLTNLRARYDRGDGSQQALLALEPAPRRTEADPCLACPVMAQCTKAMSAVPYYTIGFVFERDRPPYSERYIELHELRRRDIERGDAPETAPATDGEQLALFAV